MANIIVILILLVIVGLAIYYIWKSKKNGNKCIGCLSSGGCSKCNCSESRKDTKEDWRSKILLWRYKSYIIEDNTYKKIGFSWLKYNFFIKYKQYEQRSRHGSSIVGLFYNSITIIRKMNCKREKNGIPKNYYIRRYSYSCRIRG